MLAELVAKVSELLTLFADGMDAGNHSFNVTNW